MNPASPEAWAGVTPTVSPATPPRSNPIAARLRAYGSSPRIVGVDIARGLAVLGMFGAHIGVSDPFSLGQPATWLDLVNGRSSILFAVLAGLSIAIISGRTTVVTGTDLLQARIRIVVRAVLIFAIGGLLQTLGTPIAVILPVYALLFVVSLPFLRWRPRHLFILAGVLAVVMPVLRLLITPLLETVLTYNGAFPELLVWGSYPAMIWITFVLVGLGIGRLDLGALRVQVWILLAGIVLATVGYGAGAVASAVVTGNDSLDTALVSASTDIGSDGEYVEPEVVPGSDVDVSGLECVEYSAGVLTRAAPGFFDPTADEELSDDTDAAPGFTYTVDFSSLWTLEAHSGSPFEVIGSTGFALGVLALSLLAARRLRWLLFPVSAVGAMALTAYTAHVIVLAAIGDVAFAQPDNGLYSWFVLGTLVLCTAWVVLLGRGPLERLLTWASRSAATITDRSTTAPFTGEQ